MITPMKSRLGLMMLLQYFIWGSWYVTLGTWLAALHFSGREIGWVAGTTAIGAIVSPFFVGLITSLAMRQIEDPKQEFGMVRVFGTLGWIIAGLGVGASGLEATAVPMRVAAAASLLMSLYCFTLPDTPPLARGTDFKWQHVIPLDSLRLLRRRSMAGFAL